MAAKGMNLKDLPQLLDINFALMIRNYISNAQGQLEKRKGYTELFNVGGTDPITMLEKWTDDLWMFSYGITTAVYRVSTGAITNIKTNWSAGNQNGQQYGDYFFVCNGVEKIHRISQTLNYDGETITFVVGGIVTGGISQATGVLLELLDSGTAGTLTLGNVRGVFQDNEPLTCSTGGAAVANGTLGFTATEITASPKASTLAIIQGRLLCDDVDDSGILNYSAKDNGTNPPFNDWTVGTDATDAGRLTNRNIGRIRSIVPLGQFFYVLGDTGEFAFYIQVIDSAGALTKTDEFVTSRVSLGGARGAITTDQGIFLANEAGLWQTVSLGQQDVPFSKQSQLNSVNLGKKYFEDVDFSNSDIAYDEFNRLVLVTCAKDSIENNLVIVYNIDNQSFAEFTGWNFTRFMVIEKTLYAGSTSGNAVYKLFDGNMDGEFDITTLYIQEVNGTPLNYANWIKGAYFQGFLSDSSEIGVNFDKFTRNGIYVPDAAQFLWTASGGSTYYDEYGSASYGASGWGGAGTEGGLVDDFTGCRPMIRDYQRIRVRITETSKYPHTLNWFSLLTESKTPSRRVNMARITT